jgi:hypothetical protein
MFGVLIWWHGMYNCDEHHKAHNSVEKEARSKVMGLKGYFKKKKEEMVSSFCLMPSCWLRANIQEVYLSDLSYPRYLMETMIL